MFWPIVLLIISVGLIFAEILLPSFGALGIGAILALVGGSIMAFGESSQSGFIFLIVSLLVCTGSIFIAYRILPMTPFGKKLFLIGPEPTAQERRGVDSRLNMLAGKEGTTISLLRPAGVAQIDGQRVDVVSTGDSIEPGTAVKVVLVDGNRVVVTTVSKS